MAKKVAIHDYITPITRILDERNAERPAKLRRLIHCARKINNRHLYRHHWEKTVERLLEPNWRKRVARFDPAEWREIAELVWSRAADIIGPVPPPELILFPGFGRFNGRVYQLDRKPIIGCSPDFPQTTGRNLSVLLAHEFAHFARWRTAGARCDDVPINVLIYEEGWAVWLSGRILPEYERSRLIMSRLHKSIGLADPMGGYFHWCRQNLKMLARASQKVLRSKKHRDLGRFFQCLRFKGEDTPIRTGYYLGFRLIEMLSKRMSPRELLRARPSPKQISEWLDELVQATE